MRPYAWIAAACLLMGGVIGCQLTASGQMHRKAMATAAAQGLDPATLERGPRKACPAPFWSFQARGEGPPVVFCVRFP